MRLFLSVFILSFLLTPASGSAATYGLCLDLFRLDVRAGPVGRLVRSDRKSNGGQEGFWVLDESGVHWYLKKDLIYTELQTGADVISSLLYRHFGYNTPVNVIIHIRGVRYVASRDVGIDHVKTNFLKMNNSLIRQMRIFAAYLKDWDRSHPDTHNNLLSPTNILTILDFGGSLGAGAMGDFKRGGPAFSPAIGNFEATTNINVIYGSFRPSGISKNHPWQKLTLEDVQMAMEKLKNLDDKMIEDIVDQAQYSRKEDRDYMIIALKMRRDGLIADLPRYFANTIMQ